nr:MAG TPA: hypothetical protein [Caudoviricetes sp.]
MLLTLDYLKPLLLRYLILVKNLIKYRLKLYITIEKQVRTMCLVRICLMVTVIIYS